MSSEVSQFCGFSPVILGVSRDDIPGLSFTQCHVPTIVPFSLPWTLLAKRRQDWVTPALLLLV